MKNMPSFLILISCFITCSCHTTNGSPSSVHVSGRVLSLQNVPVNLGGVIVDDDLIYEFQPDGENSQIIALIPTMFGFCPDIENYRSHMYAVEYVVNGGHWIVPDENTPSHLRGGNVVVNCRITG
jgi:hypothetical protein